MSIKLINKSNNGLMWYIFRILNRIRHENRSVYQFEIRQTNHMFEDKFL